jgi:hypothetical protein
MAAPAVHTLDSVLSNAIAGPFSGDKEGTE